MLDAGCRMQDDGYWMMDTRCKMQDDGCRRELNILIFSFSHIGDAVLSTAVIEPLQEHFPDSRVSILVGPKAQEIFRGDDRISEIIIYDNRGLHAGFNGKLRLIKELRARRFDLVVDLRDSLWSRFIGGTRWGVPSSRRLKTRYRKLHAVDRYLDILGARDVKFRDAAPGIRVLDFERQAASNFLSRKGVADYDMLIGIHLGGGWPYKLWPVERFAALGDLVSRNYGAKVLVFAGPDEESLQRDMFESMEFLPILVKDVGLRELAALINQCRLYIGNDTGPMHMAAAVGTRVIAIFGPTDADRTGPYGSEHIVISEEIDCSPCHPGRRPGGCKRGSCLAMEAVSFEQVAEVVESALND